MSQILQNQIFEAISSAAENVYIFVRDMNEGLIRFSRSAVEYFGLEGEYTYNPKEDWILRIHPDERDDYERHILDVLKGKVSRLDYQYRVMNRFGEYIWVECKGNMMRDADGTPTIFAGVMTRLDNQNQYDSLTGLSTLYSFNKYDFSSGSGYVILVGIDEFRKIVSNFGYSCGDRVLVEFSKNLKTYCGPKNELYRMSGDEFLMILPDTDQESAKQFFYGVRDIASNIILDDGKKISLSVSAGGCAYPSDGTMREIILNKLEHSLEYRKNTRRGTIAFFSKKISDMHERTQKIKDELHRSINNNFSGFELYFQPLVKRETSRIVGCEALLRWHGETVSDSRPDEFIKILEDSGEIVPVGRWVMEQAVKQQSIWQQKYGDIQVSFNVSYQQFFEQDFARELISMVRKYNVNPENMIVELTESRQVEHPDELAGIFRNLIDEGFQLALDDFGTAYASFEMLKKLPTSFIKIEHSFVRELAEPGHEIDYIIIENMLSLCRRIDCKSIIEGVENEDVDTIIKNMDSTYLQGYFYSKPVALEEFEKLLEVNFKK